VITVPIIVYIMASHFETLPRELEEAAQIDGAGAWTTFRHVALPLARPGIVGGVHPVVHLLVEQLRVRRGAVGPRERERCRSPSTTCSRSSSWRGDRWPPAAIIVTLPVLLLTIIIQKEIVVG
jgi:multiple sugar transport system permease protein